jgi:hypothetical protein
MGYSGAQRPLIYEKTCEVENLVSDSLQCKQQCCGSGSVGCMFLGIPDPDPLAIGTDTAPDLSIILQT